MLFLSIFSGYVAIGIALWGITRREEMVVFWLPVLVMYMYYLITGNLPGE